MSGSLSSSAYENGDPASRIVNAPAARLTIAKSSFATETLSTKPCGSRPMWQCASTKPGTAQPERTTVSALATGSNVSRSPTTYRSRSRSAGNATARTRRAIMPK